MRSAVTLLALGLLFLAVAAPGIEAVAGCLEACADETPGQEQCSKDACCSCCVHAGPLSSCLPLPAPALAPAGQAAASDPARVPPGRPAEILHVPKLRTA